MKEAAYAAASYFVTPSGVLWFGVTWLAMTLPEVT